MRLSKPRAVGALAAGVLLALGVAGVVLGQSGDLGGKLLTGSDITIPSGTVDHDVYAFGGRVTSNGTIAGELVTAGGVIVVNGAVQGDVIATGGQITINGTVGGHVRAAGGQVTVTGSVAKDVLAAGGQVTLSPSGKIGGDLISSGGQLALDGTVTGSATGSAGSYSRTGSVGGTDSIVVSQTDRGPILPPSNPVLDALRQFVAVVVIGLIALWLWPRAIRTAESAVRERPLPALGIGLVSLIGYFIALVAIVVVAIVLAIALAALGFGALLGIDLFAAFVAAAGLTLAFVLSVGFLADAIVGLALARLVFARTGSMGRVGRVAAADGSTADAPLRTDRWADFVPFVVGVAIVVIVTSLPVVGGLAKFIVILFGLGALVWALWNRRDRYVSPGAGAGAATPGPPAPPVA
jgi:hypothetical protein